MLLIVILIVIDRSTITITITIKSTIRGKNKVTLGRELRLRVQLPDYGYFFSPG